MMKQTVTKLLNLADIQINGDRPWDIQVRDERLYKKVLAGGSLALGESYMDGWWDCDALDQFFDKIFRAGLEKKVRGTKHLIWMVVKAKALNLQNKKRAYEIGKRHYDIGNNLYQKMLDNRYR